MVSEERGASILTPGDGLSAQATRIRTTISGLGAGYVSLGIFTTVPCRCFCLWEEGQSLKVQPRLSLNSWSLEFRDDRPAPSRQNGVYMFTA